MSRIQPFAQSLYGQITLVFLLIVILLGVVLISLSQHMAKQGELAVMQGVNRSTAMYITQQAPLITETGLQEKLISELAERALIINPGLEIYIADPDGNILSHRLDPSALLTGRIDINAIKAFIAGAPLPVMGDDPLRFPQKTVFSASPINYEGELKGYVYAVVGGQIYHAMQQETQSHYYSNLFLWLAIIAIAGALCIAALLAFILTRPLSRLRTRVENYELGGLNIAPPSPQMRNEIGLLKNSFYRMQETISTQVEAIQQLDQTRRELIANVSHDLRTPLAALQGTLELMFLNYDHLDAKQQSESIQSAFKQSQRLSRLVSDLFDLATLESGGITPKLECFSVCELLQDCSHDLSHLAQQRGVTLKLAIPSSGDTFVNADIGLIQRVLENLISNAIRHTPAGGIVTLSAEASGQGARVAIADTGVGISSAELPHIFDRFYQSKEMQHSSNIGSGLGLAIVKRILAIHNARIEVSSRLNTGTCFEFELG